MGKKERSGGIKYMDSDSINSNIATANPESNNGPIKYMDSDDINSSGPRGSEEDPSGFWSSMFQKARSINTDVLPGMLNMNEVNNIAVERKLLSSINEPEEKPAGMFGIRKKNVAFDKVGSNNLLLRYNRYSGKDLTYNEFATEMKDEKKRSSFDKWLANKQAEEYSEFKQQEKEGEEHSKGIVENFSDIHDVTTAKSWLGGAIGNVAGYLPSMVGTMGYASFPLEVSEVSSGAIKSLADNLGISEEDVLRNKLFDPQKVEWIGLLAGALDKYSFGKMTKLGVKGTGVSALKGEMVEGVVKKLEKTVDKTVLEKIIQNRLKGTAAQIAKNEAVGGAEAVGKDVAEKSIIKSIAKSPITKTLEAPVTEFATEGTQTGLEQYGAASGSDTEFNPDYKAMFNAGMSGLAGAAPFGAYHGYKQRVHNKVSNTIKQAQQEGKEQQAQQKQEDAVTTPLVPTAEDVANSQKEDAELIKSILDRQKNKKESEGAGTGEGVGEEGEGGKFGVLYHTTSGEVKDIGGGTHRNGGIMHMWQDGNDNSVGLFTVAPSETGDISPDNRDDAVTLDGKTDKTNDNFNKKDFGDNTYEITPKRKLNLLSTTDSGMDGHYSSLKSAAITYAESIGKKATTAFNKFFKNIESRYLEDHDRQKATSAFLRSPDGGEFDGIVYKNNIEGKPETTTVGTAETKESKATGVAETTKTPQPTTVVKGTTTEQKGGKQQGNTNVETPAAPKVAPVTVSAPATVTVSVPAAVKTAVDKLSNKNENEEDSSDKEFDRKEKEYQLNKEAKKGTSDIIKKYASNVGAIVKKLTSLHKSLQKNGADDKTLKHVQDAIDEHQELLDRKSKPKPKKEAKPVKLIEYKGKKQSLGVWRDTFAKNIATAMGHARSIAIDNYQEFRKAVGMKPASDEAIKKMVESESGKKKQKNEQKYKASEKLSKKQAANEVAKSLGIEPSDNHRLDLLSATKHAVNYLKDLGLSKLKQTETTFEDVIGHLPKVQQTILRALHNIANKYKTNEKSKTRFIKYHVPSHVHSPIGGFHFSTSNTDSSIIGIMVDEATGETLFPNQNPMLHEYLHEYTKMMFHRLYAQSKDFRSHIGATYDRISKATTDRLTELRNALKSDAALTNEQRGLLIALYEAADDPANIDSVLYSDKELSQFVKEMPLFHNAHELMAYSLSDPHYLNILSHISMGETIKSGTFKGKVKTALYQWFEDLTKWVKAKMGVNPVVNNAMDHLMNTIGIFDEEFSKGELQRLEDKGFIDANIDPATSKVLNAITFVRAKNKANTNLRTIVNKIAHSLDGRANTIDDVKNYLNGVNAHLPEANRLDVNGMAKKIMDRIKKVKKIRTDAQTYKQQLASKFKAMKESDKTWKLSDDVADFLAVDVDKLPVKPGANVVKIYMDGLAALINGGIPSPESNAVMLKYGKAATAVSELTKIASKLNQNFFSWIPSWANPATLVSIISKYNTPVANKVMQYIYGGAMRAAARATMESTEFVKMLSIIASKHNFVHGDLARIGMYGAVRGTLNKDVGSKEWHDEVLKNAMKVVENAKNKLEAYNTKKYPGDLNERNIKTEVEEAELLLKAVKDGKLDSHLNEGQKKIYDIIIDFAKSHFNDFRRNSVGMWKNERFTEIFNYFPTLTQGSLVKDDLKNNPFLRNESDNLMEAIHGGAKGLYGEVYSKKVWSNYQRNPGKGYFYEYDALALAQRWSKSMLYDLYATKELKTVNRVLESSDLRKAFNAATIKAFRKHLVSITKGQSKNDDNVSAIMKKALKARDTLYTGALATSGQIVLQSSSGFVAAAVLNTHLNPITSFRDFNRAVKLASSSTFGDDTSKLNTFLKEHGLGIQLRDVLFEKYLTAADYQKYLSGVKVSGFVNKMENGTEWALRSGDKLAARLVWFSAFFNAGGNLKNPTKEAVLEAERVTGALQNMSDMSFSAPIFRYDSNAQKLLMGMFMAFKSFSTNSALNLFYSTRYALSEKEARQVLSSQLGSIFAYHALAEVAVKPLYAAVASAIAGDDDKDKEEKHYSTTLNIISQTVWDALIGGWAPTSLDALLRFAFNKTAAPALLRDPYGEFDQTLDSPIYSAKTASELKDRMLELGPGFREGIDLMVGAAQIVEDAGFGESYWDSLDKYDKKQMDEEEFLWKATAALYGGIKGMPLRGDAKRIMEAIARRKKALRLNEKASGGALKNEENQEQTIQPQFEFKDYKIDNKNF